MTMIFRSCGSTSCSADCAPPCSPCGTTCLSPREVLLSLLPVQLHHDTHILKSTRRGVLFFFNPRSSRKMLFWSQVDLYEECGSQCQMVGLPCNGSCPSGTFLCGEVKPIVQHENLSFFGSRFAQMILNKTSIATARESVRS